MFLLSGLYTGTYQVIYSMFSMLWLVCFFSCCNNHNECVLGVSLFQMINQCLSSVHLTMVWCVTFLPVNEFISVKMFFFSKNIFDI